MHIVELRLLNWCRFRGSHRIVLGPTVYGITARKHDNPLASNWSGKTGLLDAIRFVLYGTHDKPTEAGWITHGEQEGGVGVLLSDGTVVERRRGKDASSERWWCDAQLKGHDGATRLAVRTVAGQLLIGGVAQDHLDRVLGLGATDFDATCWVEQKQAARFVTAKPAERMSIINGWLRLEPLRRAEAAMTRQLGLAFNDETKLIERYDAVARLIAKTIAVYLEDAPELTREVMAELAAIEQDCKQALDDTASASKRARAAAVEHGKRTTSEAERWTAAKRNADRVVSMREERDALDVSKGKLIETRLETEGERLQKDFETKGDAASKLGAAHASLCKLAKGHFDGVCPLDGHTCPDTESMNRERTVNVRKAADALNAYDAAEKARNLARYALEENRAARAELRTRQERYYFLTTEMQRLVGDIDYVRTHEAPKEDPIAAELEQQAVAAERAHIDASARLESIRSDRAALVSYQEQMTDTTEQLARLRRRIKVMQAALLILGRQGAQRRVAEGAVETIASKANAALAEAGVALTVGIRWARETKELAESCARCGAVFGKSRTIKVCPRCSAERGMKLSEKVEVEVSDTSGAAEDIAGVALQLGAASWLRAVRDAQWSTVLLDEPLASADPVNRRAMSQHFVALLRGSYGFEQAFVVAHTSDAIDTLPARIEIVAHENGSTVEVLS